MSENFDATEVIKDKLWITYDDQGNKSGMLKLDYADDGSDQYIFLPSNGDEKTVFSAGDARFIYNFKERTVSTEFQKHVFGYPVIDTDAFQHQEMDNLPCFTKTLKSTVFFTAGYYGINFDNGGWMESFCPKFTTLKRYPFIGPFKSEVDMTIAITRKKRNNESS